MADKPKNELKSKEEKKSIHTGHRERVKERFRSGGLQSFSEHEVLELLLMYAIPQKDVNPLAHELIARFGGLSNVLDADESDLLRVPGVGRNAAVLLTMMPQLMRYYQISACGKKPMITNFEEARAYCAPLFLGAKEEHVYLVCLDQSGHVLHLTLLHRGTIDEVMLYPRAVVGAVIRHNAHAVLLAHNHPSGITEPSQADYDTTIKLVNTLEGIQVRLMDHLIYTDHSVYSMIRKSQFGDMETEVNFSYIVRSRNVPGTPGTLREEQNEWISLTADDLKTWNE